ncbi:putative FAD-linked oxidoreductase [Actinomadura rubteroloni]|uniref:Putative FAD-linked oxidoreductase n=1 Tax=Actinomadura rubteroloni TaxID=1926885 RepID=A0A2P4UH61_9ACTN|nr:FAD-binding oxidoreductase [Actinomadura rubteroloni]POM24369.1 putative FAD-linked oxidoreductase [Actinomadura rubteroloni]
MDALDALAGACADVRPAAPEEGVLGVAPRFVAAPATVEEASALLRAAAGHGLAVVARGGETRLDWGPPPARCDLLVDTRRLDRIVEHAAGDLVVTAEAGVPLDVLNAALAEHGQRLALDGAPPGSTVGGTVAAGAAGPLRLLYGTPRDLVIGLTIVRADGTVARSGGKVVKNVAGYDLGRLFAGSFGTLGLIVSATFRLHPLPAARAFVSQTYGSAAEAYDAVHAVLHGQAAAAAIECATTPGAGYRVDVLLEGVAEALPARADRVASLIGGTVAATAPDGWGAYPDGSTLVETSVPPASLKDLLTGPHAETAALTWSASGHGWAGLPAGTAPERVVDVLAALRGVGGAVVRFAPEDVRAAVDVWGSVPALALMRRVKDQFDPEHRLSPGRFAGGI